VADGGTRRRRSPAQPPILEALAAARHLDAEVCLAAADDHESLRTAAASFDVPVRVVSD
jgi:hypothetical protein